MSNLPISDGGSGKSGFLGFWGRAEGKFGLGFNIAVAAVIFWYWAKILPFLLGVFEDTIKLGVMAAIIAIVLYPDTRRLLWFGYKSLMRGVTKMFVDIDAIGVLKSLIGKAKKRKKDFEDAIGEIRGQRQRLNEQLKETKKEFDRAMSALETATTMQHDRNEERARTAARLVQLESKQSKRMKSLLEEQTGFMDKYNVIVKILERYAEVCADMILDMDRDIKFRKQQQDQSRSFRKGMRAVNGIMRGSPDDEEMRDLAIESLEEEYGGAMGEVENVLALTKDVLMRADFNDAQAINDASKRLAEWKNENAGVTLNKSGVNKGNLIAEAERAAGVVLDIPTPKQAIAIPRIQAAPGLTDHEDW